MPTSPGRKKTSLEIEISLWKAVQKATIDREATYTDAVEEGLRMWLARGDENAGQRQIITNESDSRKNPNFSTGIPTKDFERTVTSVLPDNSNLGYSDLTAKLNDMSESLRTIESLIRGNLQSGSASLVRDSYAGHSSGEPTTDEVIAESSKALAEFKEVVSRAGERLDEIESREAEGPGGRRKGKKRVGTRVS